MDYRILRPIIENILSNFCHSIGDNTVCYITTATESVCSDFFYSILYLQCLNTAKFVEKIIRNHFGCNLHCFQIFAAIECVVSYACNAAWE